MEGSMLRFVLSALLVAAAMLTTNSVAADTQPGAASPAQAQPQVAPDTAVVPPPVPQPQAAPQADWQAVETFAELEQAFAALPPAVPKADHFRAYLLGGWEASWDQQGIALYGTTSYSPDGTFTSITTYDFGEGYRTSQQVTGKWSVTAVDEQRFAITFSGPEMEHGPRTVRFRIIDENTVEDEESGVVSYRLQGNVGF
jgi:hypothetical protein